MRVRVGSLVLILALASAAGVSAQSLTGRVADPQGAVVVGAQVSLTAAGRPRMVTQTSAEGTFSFATAEPGQYALRVESPGFVASAQNVTLPVASALAVTLQVAGVTEGIVVAARTPLDLNTAESSASRLSLPPIETPASIAMVSGQVVRDIGMPSLIIAKSLAPGITASSAVGSGGNVLTARGFNGVNSVKQLFNGMEIYNGGGTVSFPFDPWNVDHIAVLSGPASVMYGSGAIGGAVNVVPKRPNPAQRQQEVVLSGGSFNTYHAAIGSTGPLTQRLSYRVDLSKNTSDHWVDRGKSDSLAFSASLRFDATPALHFTLSNDFGDQNPSTYLSTPVLNNAPVSGLRYKNYNVGDARVNFGDDWTNLETVWTPSANVSVHNNTFALYHDRVYHDAFTFAYVPATGQVRRTNFRDINSTWETQYGDTGYVKVAGRLFGLKNEVLVGIDYNRNYYHRNDNIRGGTSLVDALNFDPGIYANFYSGLAIPFYRMRVNQVAGFAEDHLSLTDGLSLVLGVRQDRYHIKRYDNQTLATTVSDSDGTGRNIGAVQNLVHGLVVYGQYAAGSDPVNSFSSIAANQQGFHLSPGQQFEAGLKQSTWQGRVEWTVAGYRLVKKGVLTPSVLNPSLTEQVGRQSSRGVEGSLAIGAGPVRVIANGTVLNARFDEFFAAVGGASVSLAGNVPLNVPEQSANLLLFVDATQRLELRSVLRYVGRRFADNTNVAASLIPSYRVLDFGVRFAATRLLSVDLRVDNALDEIYADNGSTTAWQLGPPRGAYVGVNVRF